LSDIFPLVNSWLLVMSLILAFAGVILNANGRHKTAIALLFFSALAIRLFMAHLDPYLHDWDERYHALVARNMMHHPFKPMLIYKPLVAYDYTNWAKNHIWLHKQPLFLWQMALAMKAFGVSEFTMRYPTVLTGALAVLLVYRVTALATGNRKMAFIAALIQCFSNFVLEITSGVQGIDHNDAAFQFYVLASIWAYAEYRRVGTVGWAVLAGVLAGGAVLNKWLPGMLVFLGWGVILAATIKKEGARREAGHFIIAVACCVVVFLPWQLYTLHTFPREAKWELAYNSQHLFNTVEGHKGDGFYYYSIFPRYFGNLTWWLVIIGLVIVLIQTRYRNKLMNSLVLNFLFAFVFYSFVVQTKMAGFFMMASPIGSVFLAIALVHCVTGRLRFDKSTETVSFSFGFAEELLHRQKYAYIIIGIALCVFTADLPQITTNHDPRNNMDDHIVHAYNTEILKKAAQIIPPGTDLVLNTSVGYEIDLMFYNNDVTAYAWSLTREEFDSLVKQKPIKLAVFEPHGIFGLPDYVMQYPDKVIINEVLR
jgi:hypothetical protein